MRTVTCPQCGAEVEWQKSPFRPFCSERCRLVDLGAWLDERYAIPGDPANVGTEEDGEEKE
jgi:hypothetical protein